ncbi:MAG TPA: WD40 repeat domain-containing protein [Planctomycetota bacterium]|nr:WD40 repeat domain-containing protein [Planctomycetota bacterium]
MADLIQPKRRSKWLRFSLRTLLLASLFAGSAGLLWRNWAPWRVDIVLPYYAFLKDDRTHLIAQGGNGKRRVLNLSQSGVETIFETTLADVGRLELSQDSAFAISSGSAEHQNGPGVCVWDMRTGEMLAKVTLGEWQVAISRHGHGRAVVSNSDSLTIWDVASKKTVFGASGNFLIVFPYSGISLEGEELQRHLDELFKKRSAAASAVEFDWFVALMNRRDFEFRVAPGGERLITAFRIGQGFKAQLWDTATLRKISDLDLPATAETPDATVDWEYPADSPALKFSDDGKKIYDWNLREFRLWDSESGALEGSFTTDFAIKDGGITSNDVRYINGKVLFRIDNDSLWIYDPHGKPLVLFSEISYGQFQDLDVSVDGTRLQYRAGGNGSLRSIRIADANTGEKLTAISFNGNVMDSEVKFLPDGRLFATGFDDNSTRIYRRVRSEQWWGVVCLWEFWLCVALLGATLLSFVRDTRTIFRSTLAL